MAKNINKKTYSEQTLLKLDIFRECFREWFPVFLHNQRIEHIYIYDLFAGSGTDIDGTYGSPLILLEEARGDKRQHCNHFRQNKQKIAFAFNEFQKSKVAILKSNVDAFFANCKRHCPDEICVYASNCYFNQGDFQELFQNSKLNNVLQDPKYGKFILLDQYGFKQVDDEVFTKLTNAPKTDFIFFVSSSTLRRFQDSEVVKAYLKNRNVEFDDTKPKECHRVIANYFRSLVPSTKEYYIHHFTIKNQSNYYGLIFCSNHSFGMEKFLKVCWKHDTLSGEANFKMNEADFEENTIFYSPENSIKNRDVMTRLEHLILSGQVGDNISGMKYVLKEGCLPSLFPKVIESLIKQKRILISGKFNKQVIGIHKAAEYKIKVEKDENNEN